jgi:translation initiation factor 2 subunit 1
MFYRKEGSPEENEIVLCQVTKIYPNSVFVNLLEYRDSGMVHISEVSPGRIRNLRDYVSVGKQIVCKIIKIDKERGHIDLSLRRVNSNQRKEKLEEIKQELKAESILKSVSKRIKIPVLDIYKKVSIPIFKEYVYIYDAFRDVADGDTSLEKLGVSNDIAKELNEIILDKFKPEKISIQGKLEIKTYDSLGVEKIKKTLESIENVSETISLHYLGGGRYRIIIEDLDYLPAEKDLKKVQEIIDKFNDKLSEAKFEREKKD